MWDKVSLLPWIKLGFPTALPRLPVKVTPSLALAPPKRAIV